MAPRATEFHSQPAALKLLPHQKERFYLKAGESISPELRVSGRMSGNYVLHAKITDLYYRTRPLPAIRFSLSAPGETTVKLPFSSADLPFGPSELEARLTLPDGTEPTRAITGC